jgi:lysophospholipase L1-like esterase
MAVERRTASPRDGSVTTLDSTRAAVRVGTEIAEKVRRERTRALRSRAAAIATAPRTVRAKRVAIDPRFIRAAGAKGIATLVAEGDSWFDYFWYDVLNMLEDEHGFDVESVAGAGHRVEDMAYDGGQLVEFKRVLEKLLRRAELPKAILLSGGGNDIAGSEFAMLLDHAGSPNPGLNEDVIRGVVDVRVRNAYVSILAAVTELCVATTGHTIPIVLHGYDWPVPDGRGVAGGAGPLPGPWLRPGFHQKGFLNPNQNKETMRVLIDRFNRMVKRVTADPRFPHVRFVDLRGALPNTAAYQEWWANELHPTRKGFRAVAQRFADALAKV